MINLKSLDKNIVVDNIVETKTKVKFHAHMMYKYCVCPICNNRTKSVHSIHMRHIQDLPIHNKTTYINLETRHMHCRECGKIFTENMLFVEPTAHMTKRLKEHIIIMSTPNSSLIATKQLQQEGIRIKKSSICEYLKKRSKYQLC